mmetsp:Transcript_47289/g.120654  ORF Transcript_47289/g.120654 Transcript_47289/m.120654 type:complete len:613 (+) Transcript_47289:133-1971(+)
MCYCTARSASHVPMTRSPACTATPCAAGRREQRRKAPAGARQRLRVSAALLLVGLRATARLLHRLRHLGEVDAASGVGERGKHGLGRQRGRAGRGRGVGRQDGPLRRRRLAAGSDAGVHAGVVEPQVRVRVVHVVDGGGLVHCLEVAQALQPLARHAVGLQVREKAEPVVIVLLVALVAREKRALGALELARCDALRRDVEQHVQARLASLVDLLGRAGHRHEEPAAFDALKHGELEGHIVRQAEGITNSGEQPRVYDLREQHERNRGVQRVGAADGVGRGVRLRVVRNQFGRDGRHDGAGRQAGGRGALLGQRRADGVPAVGGLPRDDGNRALVRVLQVPRLVEHGGVQLGLEQDIRAGDHVLVVGGRDAAQEAQQVVVQGGLVVVAHDVDLNVGGRQLRHDRRLHALQGQGLDLLGLDVPEAAVVAQHGGEQAVRGRALQALGERAVVAEVDLLGALHGGLFPARLPDEAVEQLKHGLDAAVADREVDVHEDHLVAGLDHAVDELADAEELHLLALPVADAAALAQRARADAHRAAARGAGAGVLAGAPSGGDEAEDGGARLVHGVPVVDGNAVAELALRDPGGGVRGRAGGAALLQRHKGGLVLRDQRV